MFAVGSDTDNYMQMGIAAIGLWLKLKWKQDMLLEGLIIAHVYTEDKWIIIINKKPTLFNNRVGWF
ncbi:hypothetical protein SALWKB12_1931 [Snodgrassella communis]|uniref:Uncharacterized protein n=1 Tax=Snodgrassella communis TaxID=2946699 RepID=A0A066TDZ5_9NEIS|nr:hypothetical protein SALWKB12_1931 [Snodgrassella communis]KDN14256.1 hypothetical protein SALWKB29_1746 [Snodgrassella communis]PIT06637.1 hypothetical protein BGI29_11030 [Snodgrassella communis]